MTESRRNTASDKSDKDKPEEAFEFNYEYSDPAGQPLHIGPKAEKELAERKAAREARASSRVSSDVSPTEFLQSEGDPLSGPLLPPTLAEDLRANNLENLIPTLRAQMAEGAKERKRGELSEVNKFRLILERAEKEPLFEKSLRRGLQAGTLSEAGRTRAEAALEILDSARREGLPIGDVRGRSRASPLVQKTSTKAPVSGFSQWRTEKIGGWIPESVRGGEDAKSNLLVSEMIASALIKKQKLGPEGKARAYLRTNPTTGRTVMDIEQTHSDLKGRYYREYLNQKLPQSGIISDSLRAAATKYAVERSTKDIFALGARFQGIPFLDGRSQETIENIADTPAGLRGLRAHFRTRTTTDVFAPTLEELEREGGFWAAFRKLSPYEYAAPQVKLLREHLEKHPAGKKLAPYLMAPIVGGISPAGAMVLLGTPLGYSERLLERAGYTPEEIVDEYLDQTYWLDEAKEGFSLMTKESFRLRGFSEEEAELERQRALKSWWNTAAAFVTYFSDPDGITMGLMGAGKAARYGKSKYFKDDLTRGIMSMQYQAENAENASDALRAIEAINPSVGRLARLSVESSTTAPATRLRDTEKAATEAQKQFDEAKGALQQTATDASESLGEFVRAFIDSGESIEVSPAFIRTLDQIRQNPTAPQNQRFVQELKDTYESSINAASTASVEGAKAQKDLKLIITRLEEIETANAEVVRLEGEINNLAKRVLHAVSFNSGPEAANAVREFWFAERRIKQLQIVLDQTVLAEDMVKIPLATREKILVARLLGASVEETKTGVRSVRPTFQAAPKSVDDLNTKELVRVARELGIKRAPSLGRSKEGVQQLRELVRESARTLTSDQLRAKQIALTARIKELRALSRVNKAKAKKLMSESPKGRERFDRLLKDQEDLRKYTRDYKEAVRLSAPPAAVDAYKSIQSRLQGIIRQSEKAVEGATRTAVRSFSLNRLLTKGRSPLRIRLPSKAAKINKLTPTVFRLGEESPDIFRISSDDAIRVSNALDTAQTQKTKFEAAKTALENAQRKNTWRQALRDTAARLEEGRDSLTRDQIWKEASYRIRPGEDPQIYKDVLNNFVKLEDGEVRLHYRVGDKTIVEAFEEVGIPREDLQAAILSSGKNGLKFQKVLDTQKPIQFVGREVDELSQIFPKELQSIKTYEDGAANAALLAIRSQVHLPLGLQKGYRRYIGTIISPFAALIRWLARPGEQAFSVRVGLSSEDSVEMLRGAEQLTNQRSYELERLIRTRKGAAQSDSELFSILDEYLSTGNAMELGTSGGAPIHSITNVGEPLFLRAKRRILLWHRNLDLDATAKESAAASGSKVGRIYGPKSEYDPSLLAFSRIWLGDDFPAKGGKAAANLYKAAYNVLTDPEIVSFKQAVEAMAAKTVGILGEGASLDPRKARVYGFAGQAISTAAVLDQITPAVRAATVGLLDPDIVADTNRILRGEVGELAKIKDPDAAIKTLLKIGGAFFEPAVPGGNFLKRLTGDAEKIKDMVRVGADPTGQDLFTTAALRNELMASLNGKIKELTAVSSNQPAAAERLLDSLLFTWMPWWKQSVTMGWLLPNAGYITYVRIGDISQLFLTSGVSFTLRSQLQNVWSDIPFFGSAFQNHLATQMAKTGKPALRGALETSFNPHLADFLSAKDGFWKLKNGDVVSWAGLRERAVRDGVMDLFTSVELDEGLRSAGLSVAEKIQDAPLRRFVQNSWSESIKDFAAQTQMRQRAGTWLMHINDGKSIDEASKLVRESLYDWSHGVARWEQLTLARIFLFHRYWRLPVAQSYETIMKPFMNPTNDGFIKAAYGDTRMNRFRILGRSQMDLDQTWSDPRSPEEIVRDDGYTTAFGRIMGPKWLTKQFSPYNQRNDALRARQLAKLQQPGKNLIQTAGVLPPYHGIEHLEMMLLPFFGLAGTACKAVGEDAAADYFINLTAEKLVDNMGPWYRETLEGSYDKPGTNLSSIRPVEAWMLENLSPLRVEYDPETGKHFTAKSTKRLMAILPVVGAEIPRTLDAIKFKNPQMRTDLKEGLKRMFLEYTRIVREYSYDPYANMDFRFKETLNKYQEDSKRAGYLIEKPK